MLACYAELCGDGGSSAISEIEAGDGEDGSRGACEEDWRRGALVSSDSFPAGLFAAGGTGEFFSLTMPEFASVVLAAVQQTNKRVPVVAGCGYGTAIAK